jgi:hypothetical protein
MKDANMFRLELRTALLVSALAAPGAAALASPACPTPAEVTHQHLYGVWRAEFDQGTPGASLRLEKHAEYSESVSGEITRGGARAKVAGDVEDGTFQLEESTDGTSIAATWTGQVVDKSCGKEIKGTWKNHKDGTQRAFVLRKPPGWQ